MFSPLQPDEAYWSWEREHLLQRLDAKPQGLTSQEAESRLRTVGQKRKRHYGTGWAAVLWNQLKNPLLLVLFFAAGASAVTGSPIDAAILITILTASVGIGFSREFRAQAFAATLKKRISTKSTVWRDGQLVQIRSEEIVPGDVIRLSAGSLIPGDGVLLDSTDFFVNEAILTGESFPAEKMADLVSTKQAGVGSRRNCVFQGTNVRSGTADCMIVHIGNRTQFGQIAHRLELRSPENEFDRGLRHFGQLLTMTMMIVMGIIFAANILLGRPPIQTLMFSIALAVGLSPELLPVILTVNLARGSEQLARQGVLVRKLNAIENLGSMNILCTDKTGTLTEGVVQLEGAYDETGQPSDSVLEAAFVNASLQTGLVNPLDEAIINAGKINEPSPEKLAEIPYDFVRKCLSVVVRQPNGIRLITKGAVSQVLQKCVALSNGEKITTATRNSLQQRVQEWNAAGIRVLAIADRTLDEQQSYNREDERDLRLLGFLTFLDPPKSDVADALQELSRLGISVKLISGDAILVATHVASCIGMSTERVLTGQQIDELHDEALWKVAEDTSLFVEVDPNQKERIILALKKMGHVVGFLGDGVNDAPAMHAADVGISVDQAVDVAKEAADILLLERNLNVISRGVQEGRRTFANSLKYVLTTTSANLGNMISMAVASLMLPFLPLLASQILLNNLLADLPALGIADDTVDPELIDQPKHWNMQFIRKFMIEFGLLSSLFDFLTFGLLLGLFSAGPALFRTGWFVESLLTELVIAMMVRTRRPFYRSRPGTLFLWLTAIVTGLTFAIPYLPFAGLFEFVPLPPMLLVFLVLITIMYVCATEALKIRFYKSSP